MQGNGQVCGTVAAAADAVQCVIVLVECLEAVINLGGSKKHPWHWQQHSRAADDSEHSSKVKKYIISNNQLGMALQQHNNANTATKGNKECHTADVMA